MRHSSSGTEHLETEPLQEGPLCVPNRKAAVTEQPTVYTSVLQTDRYGLEGRAIEARWGAKFTAPVQIGHRVHPASDTIGTGLKWPEASR